MFGAVESALGSTLYQWAFTPALKIVIVLFGGVLPVITYLVLAERKILGFMQVRTGPNRVGPWGLLQPIADVMKLLVKEDVIPTKAVRWAFVLAPCLVVGPAFLLNDGPGTLPGATMVVAGTWRSRSRACTA